MTQAVIHSRVLLNPIDIAQGPMSFHFVHVNTGADPGYGGDSNATHLRTAVTNTLTTVALGTGATFGSQIAQMVTRATNGCEVHYTDITNHLDGSRAGSPFAIDTFTLGTHAGSQDMPEGISLCLSRHSDYGSDPEFGAGGTRPRSRDRNRCYIGPISNNTLTTDATTKRVVFLTSALTDWLTWFKSLDDINGGPGCTWSLGCWSKVSPGRVTTATGLYADVRPDYTRLRSNPGGTRVTMALP